MKKFLIQIHSYIDVITNSSSELFIAHVNSEIINAFISEYLKHNEREYSGDGGEIRVTNFEEELTEYVNEAKRYGWYFDDESIYEYNLLDTDEDQRDFIKNYMIKIYNLENNVNLNNICFINIDWANRNLILKLKEYFDLKDLNE